MMSRATALLGEIITKARMAEALVTCPESKQAMVEIRLSAGFVAQAEHRRASAHTELLESSPRRHHRSKD